MNMKHIPNTLSVIRLLLVPLFVALFLNDFVTAAIIIFILAGATDVVDGYIARTFNCTSTLGKVLDPLADKFMQMSAFMCLWYKEYVPFWMPLIYFLKEICTVIGAFVIFRKTNFVVKSNAFGKLATVLVFGAVFVISLFKDSLGDIGITAICMIVAVYFIFSCGVYCGEELLKMIRASRAKKNSGK